MSKKSHKSSQQQQQQQRSSEGSGTEKRPGDEPNENSSQAQPANSRDRKRPRLTSQQVGGDLEQRHETQVSIKQELQAVPGGQESGGRPGATRPGADAKPNICAACAKPIKERYLLVALDKQWHEDCLKCACCDCRLGEVGSSLFTHSDKILCRRDFLRIFGQHGNCAACKRSIPPYELVMRANENAYHMDCFACQQCQYRFCVGDRFHLTETHKIICLVCHSEQQQQHRPEEMISRDQDLSTQDRLAAVADGQQQQQKEEPEGSAQLECASDLESLANNHIDLESPSALTAAMGQSPTAPCPIQQHLKQHHPHQTQSNQQKQEQACAM